MKKLRVLKCYFSFLISVFCIFYLTNNNITSASEDEECHKEIIDNIFLEYPEEGLAFFPTEIEPLGCIKIEENKQKSITPNASYITLCTEASCSNIKWTFGGQAHGYRAKCKTSLRFKGVPSGTYSWRASGCGVSWSNTLKVKRGYNYFITLCTRGSDLNCCSRGCSSGKYRCSECSSGCPVKLIYGASSGEVELLRQFRDEVLAKTPEGQEIINLYYQLSPVIMEAMEEDETFKDELGEMVDEVLPLVILETRHN